MVTWYRYGSPDRATAELHDGTKRPVPLVERALPEDIGIPPGQVRRLVVHLQSAALHNLVLIDTPDWPP